MDKENISKHILSIDASVKDALDAINALSGDVQLIFVINSGGKLVGTLSGGDIRRGLLKGVSLSDSVSETMNRNFTAVPAGEDPYSYIAEGKKRKLRLIPVIKDGVIADVLDLDLVRAVLPMDAVLMAGGKGERLRPLTLETPKPLLPVGGVPIIDRNIRNLESFGISNIFVTVNYLHEKIEAHFEEYTGRDSALNVKCVLEPRRLGTLGSLSLVKGLKHDNLLVMNSDLLTNIDLEKMYAQHAASGAALTVGAIPYTVSVPYAIMQTKGAEVVGLQEKPTFNYFANGGVYILQSRLMDLIPDNEYLDAPDFIETLISQGERVEFFPIDGSWIDIGSPDDYRAANALLADK